MSVNAGSCLVVKFQPDVEIDKSLQEFAEDFFEVTANDFVDDGKEQLVGYMRQDVSEKEMLQAAQSNGINLPAYTIEILQSDDWLKDNVVKFAPVEVAEFLVYGVHEKNIDTKNKIGVKVYAATAFGSEHQTTKCCLQGISDIHKLNRGVLKILDVGTGSGILAIAAAKLWSNANIVAVDIDKESVSVAKQNAKDNNVERQINVAYSDGYQSDAVQKNAPYDVICANILARPLIEMAKDMGKNLNIGGYAVISGFIEDQVDWVVEAHQRYGMEMVKIYQEDNWCATLLKKVK